MTSKDKVKIAVEALEEKKGEDIKVIDISKISLIADYFVIAGASNSSQITALIENTEKKMKENKISEVNKEGVRSNNWILLDYGDVIIHIFDRESRSFYNLERMWSDGAEIDV